MWHELYEVRPDHYETDGKSTQVTLEEFRTRLAEIMGVTLQGNRLTLRFGGKEMKQVHMVILEVDDGLPELPEQIPQ